MGHSGQGNTEQDRGVFLSAFEFRADVIRKVIRSWKLARVEYSCITQ